MNTLLVVKSLINGFFTILNIFILSQYVVTEHNSFVPNGFLYHIYRVMQNLNILEKLAEYISWHPREYYGWV